MNYEPQDFFDRINAAPTRPADLTAEEKLAIWQFMQPSETGFSDAQRQFLQRVWLVVPEEELETIETLCQNQPIRFATVPLTDGTHVLGADLLLDVPNYFYAIDWLQALYYREVQADEFVISEFIP